MAMPDEALVYVVDDDQGMLESTVWLLESVGLELGPSPRAGTSSTPARAAAMPASCSTCGCPAWAG